MRFRDKLRNFINIGIQIWNTARPTQLAAALGYYGIISLPPLLLVMYTLSWFLLGDFIVAGRVAAGAGRVLGSEVGALLNDAILSAVPTDLGGSWPLIVIGFLLLLLAASGLFLELQMALNRIWDAPPSQYHGVVSFIQRRFIAIVMLIGLGAVLIVPTRVEYELSTVESLNLPAAYVAWPILYLFFTLGLAIIYKKVPNLPIAWRDVLLAAFIVTGLVLLGGWVVFSVVSGVSISSSFEVFSLLTLLLISVNYILLIVVIGAVFCRCYALVFGSMQEETVNRPSV